MAGRTVWIAPWGGKAGNESGEFIIPDGARLTNIDIRSGEAIDFVRFTYKDQSGTDHSETFGSEAGGSFHKITFNENEYLITISGRVGPYAGITLVTSLTFQTNLRTYGPYGTNPGTEFSLGVSSGKFSGFYAKYGDYLDSLGVVLQP
ncbi:unnamed protein product [Lactuca saligna]|uniref:Jacalin-type lectin domain-containing protein n=1 Tax=Lactuca saligna TaxID=75948 RepID=A0AA35YAI7_LACSI|nr:unnamed protein product [Lactuca saligna]